MSSPDDFLETPVDLVAARVQAIDRTMVAITG